MYISNRLIYELPIILNQGQSELVEKLVKWYHAWYSNKSSIIKPKQYYVYSGAAGTGKTTVIKEVLKELGYTKYSNSYISCAYVGKAVLNLQKHGLNARTIHSLIYEATPVVKMNQETGEMITSFKFVHRKKLETDVSLIIVDEASMVNDKMRDEILYFNKPVIFIGDRHQLPAIFGVSSIMNNPDFELSQIMRQKEDDMIIKMSQNVLRDIPITPGDYGNVIVTRDLPLDSSLIHNYDQILTTKNIARSLINEYIRKYIYKLDISKPHLFEKVICRQNNWNVSSMGFSLTNGMSGTIVDISKEKLYSGYYLIDFAPDGLQDGVVFNKLEVDKKYICADFETQQSYGMTSREKFEYAYAITVHLSQGSEYNRVLYIDNGLPGRDLSKKARYTAFTRAKKQLTIVQPTGKIAQALGGYLK